ncbi:MAG TPA: response regulator [Archangium sp.]|jgi:two-component system chemotaxis response regulator CheY|uniref:response regulator n=1 Tax=Archangium sp. TaxID=1872627 RepID=UPI002F041B59
MGQHQGTVLVVEDSPLFRRMLGDMLQELGFSRVLEAFGGRAALELLTESKPDLVCLDLTLPDISGFDVCEHIRASPLHKDVPVLMISARTLAVDRAQAEEAGANGYLIKPFTPEEFRQQVERVMATRPRKESGS